ncbi:hypothetical protein ACFOMH_08310 [Paracoccus mangrovi]|uniref:Antitermination protein n=1 Tax=Paracoccus mangrovi TaxID=1715645 RepID=A0ABV7R275_9RHOB
MTPYLKGNVAGQCPRCEGRGGRWKDADNRWQRCPSCKGRKIVGKPPEQILAEMTGREWLSPKDQGEA